MQVKRFFAADMRQAMKLVRDELGAEAAIIGNRRIAGGVELTAALDYKLSAPAPRVPNMELEDELRKTQSRIVSAQSRIEQPQRQRRIGQPATVFRQAGQPCRYAHRADARRAAASIRVRTATGRRACHWPARL